MMQHLGRLALMSCFCVLISGQLDDSKFSERPYDVLQNQNLVILGSVFGILLVIMVTMAVCVYKPLPRRRTSTEGLCLQPHESREPLPTGARAQSASTYRCTSKERLYEPRDPLPTAPPPTGTSQ
ncbi:unnamed protein product [Arctogadus glacialis]